MSELPVGKHPTFKATDALSYGWRRYTASWQPWLWFGLVCAGAFVAVYVAFVVPLLVIIFRHTDDVTGELDQAAVVPLIALYTAMLLVMLPLQVVIQGAAARGAHLTVSGDPGSFTAWFRGIGFWRLIGCSLLSSLLVLVGFVLLIIPGLIFAFLSYLAPYFVVNEGQGPWQAIRSSIRISRPNWAQLLLLALLSYLVMIAGYLACGLGLLVALPVITITAASVVQVLQGKPVTP
jgi:uncharacterized membrane protein